MFVRCVMSSLTCITLCSLDLRRPLHIEHFVYVHFTVQRASWVKGKVVEGESIQNKIERHTFQYSKRKHHVLSIFSTHAQTEDHNLLELNIF